ncbi:MAG: hypothetical protein RR322_06335, partial [Oscillospiraceae bacterium]
TNNSSSNQQNNGKNIKNNEIANLSTEELILLATTISISLTQCRSNCEIKALINLFNIIQDNLIAILAQKNICQESFSEVFIE